MWGLRDFFYNPNLLLSQPPKMATTNAPEDQYALMRTASCSSFRTRPFCAFTSERISLNIFPWDSKIPFNSPSNRSDIWSPVCYNPRPDD